VWQRLDQWWCTAKTGSKKCARRIRWASEYVSSTAVVPNHWIVTTVTRESGRMPLTAELGSRASSLLMKINGDSAIVIRLVQARALTHYIDSLVRAEGVEPSQAFWALRIFLPSTAFAARSAFELKFCARFVVWTIPSPSPSCSGFKVLPV